MISVPFCYKYLFLYDFLFIHSKASIGVLEKGYLNIRKHPSIDVLKKNCSENFCLCLVMVSVPFCYKYLFLYDFLFIHSKASIGVLEKGYLNIRKHPSIDVLKKNCSENFCILCILSSEISRV